MTSRKFGHAFLWYQANHFTIHLYWKIANRVAACKHSACDQVTWMECSWNFLQDDIFPILMCTQQNKSRLMEAESGNQENEIDDLQMLAGCSTYSFVQETGYVTSTRYLWVLLAWLWAQPMLSGETKVLDDQSSTIASQITLVGPTTKHTRLVNIL